MNLLKRKSMWVLPAIVSLSLVLHVAHAQDQGKTSYMKLDIVESFTSIMARMKSAKPGIEKRQSDLLNDRYDLSNRPAPGAMIDRDKPLQDAVPLKLPQGTP